VVGVDDIRKCSKREMTWLRNRGRNKIERLAKRFNKFQIPGDFYVSIILPTDILVCIRGIGALATTVYRFDQYRREDALKLYRKLRNHPEIEEAKLSTGKKMHHLKDNEYYIDITWHGREAYWKGRSFIETVIPKTLFRKGL
jgi:hypothetical protein